ncbi:unknown [Coprococcus eutactus CAG:665]|nr:unknown [Coprococcus eutactus CAG:665]
MNKKVNLKPDGKAIDFHTKRIGATNLIIFISGNDDDKNMQIKEELMPVIRKLIHKHELGCAVTSVDRKRAKSFAFLKYLFNLNR